ncbi:syntaxin-6 [Salarias fasciatus]|uniref:Syntaxin-6-like n=1 Tax=Salarias fasciatus TaxID=181472 RepID=A0A672HPV7_SALFA|nr:syntaxin-6-like [Salarias fasciatus]
MSMEDPFFVVKGEVQKEVQSAQALHHRWRELTQELGGASRHEVGGASKEEVDWTTNELRNCLRSIEWDLEDLEETVSIVESNPKKFNLDETELKTRKNFIANTRLTVQVMKEQMCGPAGPSDRQNRVQGDPGSQGPIWQPAPQYQRLDRQLENANSQFIEEQQAQQQLMAERQDEQLQLVSGTIGVLKNMSERIGQELDEQAVMLDDFTHEVDNTQSRLDNVMKKLAKVSHMTSDRRQWCAIGVLLALLFIVILLFFIL